MREVVQLEVGDDCEAMEDDSEMGAIGCLPRFLHPAHKEELGKLSKALPSVINDGDLSVQERNEERFCKILKLYQEQPNLLDGYLQELIGIFLSFIHLPNPDECNASLDELSTASLTYLCHITTVRGDKTVVRFLPHHVDYLHKLLNCLEKYELMIGDDLRVRRMLLLWLWLVCKNPFDFRRFDPPEKSGHTLNRVLDTALRYLSTKISSCHNVAALVVAQCLGRQDGIGLIDKILKHDLQKIRDGGEDLHGHLFLLAAITKRVDRHHLLNYVDEIVDVLKLQFPLTSPDIIVRKCIVKIAQRAALLLLRPRVASWRYKRGRRRLEDNLNGTENGDSKSTNGFCDTEDDYEDEVNEHVEWIVGNLLETTKDEDTSVRWSSAKGIGRITSRLPKDLAIQITEAIVQGNFHPLAGHCSWHGGCMALGELSRRGFLLPFSLPMVIPVVKQALFYEEPLGRHFLGSNVRDAACYILWAFARAFDPQQLRPYFEIVATSLICVALFDREVKLRRAASAAFQENVGRQADFPNGIALLTVVDYFAVGNRYRCYTELSTQVIQFPRYSDAIIDHLIEKKVDHWDDSVREHAALALCRLAAYHPMRLQEKLPLLVEGCTDSNIFRRHGYLLSIANIINGLINNQQVVDSLLISRVANLPGVLKSESLSLRNGEKTRSALSKFVKVLSECRIALTTEQITSWLNLIEILVTDKVNHVRANGEIAATEFFGSYSHSNENMKVFQEARDFFCEQVRDASSEESRCGYCVLLGVLPSHLINDSVIQTLSDVVLKPRLQDKKWALGRKAAISSIASGYSGCLNHQWTDITFDTIFKGLSDYTKDAHGDIGRFVRQESMISLANVLTSPSTSQNVLERFVLDAVRHFVQQSSETIGRTRECSCISLLRVLECEETRILIPHADTLKKVFGDSKSFLQDQTLLSLAPILNCEEYFEDVIHGLILSAGGISEVTNRYSRHVLNEYHMSVRCDRELEEHFLSTIADIFTAGMKTPRVGDAVLRFMPCLLGQLPDVDFIDHSSACARIMSLLHKIASSPKATPTRIRLSIESFAALPCTPSRTWHSGISSVVGALTCPFPAIRRAAAEALFTAVCLLDVEDEILQLLQDTAWQDTKETETLQNAASIIQRALVSIY